MGYFSNGSENDDYCARHCARCAHGGEGCAVMLAHLVHNYSECNNPDSILHLLIPRRADASNAQCAMFLDKALVLDLLS